MAGVTADFRFRPSIADSLKALSLTEAQMQRKERHTLSSFTGWSVGEIQKALSASGGGQPGGEMWRGLSQQWAEYKAAKGWSPLIGVASGTMRKSISGEENFLRGESLSGVGGESEDYAEYFDARRPITPKENYALEHFQNLFFEALRSNRV